MKVAKDRQYQKEYEMQYQMMEELSRRDSEDKMDELRMQSFIEKQKMHINRKKQNIDYINQQVASKFSYKPKLNQKSLKMNPKQLKSQLTERPKSAHNGFSTGRDRSFSPIKEEPDLEVTRNKRTRSKNQRSIAGIIEPKIKEFIPLFSSRNPEQKTEPSNYSSNQPPPKRKAPVQYKAKKPSPSKQPALSKVNKEVSSEKKNPRVWEQLYEERLAKQKRMEQLTVQN